MAEKAAAERSLSEGGSIKLTLDYPPSANRYWRTTGRVYVSEEADLYKADAAVLAHQQGVRKPLQGEVSITARVYCPTRARDLDNCLKVLIDALQGVAIADDKQVTEIHAVKLIDTKRPRVEVEIVNLK